MYSTKAVAILSHPRPDYLDVDGTSLFLKGKDQRRKKFSLSTVVDAHECKAFTDNIARSAVTMLLSGESSTILVGGAQGTGKTRLVSFQAGILEALLAEVTAQADSSHLITFSAFELFDDIIIDHFAPEDDFESTISNMKVTKVQVTDNAQGLTLLEYVRNLSKNYTEMESAGVVEPAPSSSTMCFKLQVHNQTTGVLANINLIDPMPGVLQMLTTGLLDIATSGQTMEFFLSANPVPLSPITQLVLPIISHSRPMIICLFNNSYESTQYAETLLSMMHLCKTSLETTRVVRNRIHPAMKPHRELNDVIDSNLQEALSATIRSRPSVSSPMIFEGRPSVDMLRDDDMGPDMGMKYGDKHFNRYTKTSEPHYDGLYPSFNSTICEQKTPPQPVHSRPAGLSPTDSVSMQIRMNPLRPEVPLQRSTNPALYGVQEVNELTGQVYVYDAHHPAYTESTDAFPSALASSGIDRTANIISVQHNIVALDPVVEATISPSVFNSLHAESPMMPLAARNQDRYQPELVGGKTRVSPKMYISDLTKQQETAAALKDKFYESLRSSTRLDMTRSQGEAQQAKEDDTELLESLVLPALPADTSNTDLQGIKEKLTVATQALERATLYRDELLARVTDLECQSQEALLMSELHMISAQKRAADIKKIISATIGSDLPAPGSGASVYPQIPVDDIKKLLNSHEEDIDELQKKLYAEIKGQAEQAIESAIEYNNAAASRSLEDVQIKALITELRKAVDGRLKNEIKLRQLQRQNRDLSSKILLLKDMEQKHALLKQERTGKATEVRQIKEVHRKLQQQNLGTQAQLDTLKKQLVSAKALLQDIRLDASSLRIAFQNLESALASHGLDAAVFPAYQTGLTSAPLEPGTLEVMQKGAESGSAFAMQVLQESQQLAKAPRTREESLTMLEHLQGLTADVLGAISKKATASGLTTDERRLKESIEDIEVCIAKAIRARTAGSSANNCITDYAKYTVGVPQTLAELDQAPVVENPSTVISGVVDVASKMISASREVISRDRKGFTAEDYQTGYTMMDLKKMKVSAPDMARVAETSAQAVCNTIKTTKLSYEPQITNVPTHDSPVGAQMRTPLTDTLQAVQSVEKGIEERLRRLMDGYKEGFN